MFNEEMNVIRVQKKQYDQYNMPGSSPEFRETPQIEYKYKEGKAPLIQKRDSR